MPVRRCIDQAVAARAPAIPAGHVGGGARLIEKDKGVRVHEALPHAPALAMRGYIWPVLFARPQGLFLCDRPSRRSVAQIVDSEPDLIPRAISSSLISASVIPLRLSTNSRSSSSCSASSGLR